MANSTGSLVLATAQTAIGSNFLLCDQYMSLVMTGRMYADAYRERGLAPENLSRVTEDAGTVTDPLVPWGSAAPTRPRRWGWRPSPTSPSRSSAGSRRW